MKMKAKGRRSLEVDQKPRLDASRDILHLLYMAPVTHQIVYEYAERRTRRAVFITPTRLQPQLY